jgi:hypothetical protein
MSETKDSRIFCWKKNDTKKLDFHPKRIFLAKKVRKKLFFNDIDQIK